MEITVQFPTTITDENLSDLRTTAWYGGITYWATDPVSEAPEGTIISLRTEDYDVVPLDFHLSAAALGEAFSRIISRQTRIADWLHEYFIEAWENRDPKEGLDMGFIDAVAADAWVQVACFGSVVYG